MGDEVIENEEKKVKGDVEMETMKSGVWWVAEEMDGVECLDYEVGKVKVW